MGMSRGLCVLPGRWVGNLEEAFFRQGDEEKRLGLPVSPLFDRDKAGVTKSQVGGLIGDAVLTSRDWARAGWAD